MIELYNHYHKLKEGELINRNHTFYYAKESLFNYDNFLIDDN